MPRDICSDRVTAIIKLNIRHFKMKWSGLLERDETKYQKRDTLYSYIIDPYLSVDHDFLPVTILSILGLADEMKGQRDDNQMMATKGPRIGRTHPLYATRIPFLTICILRRVLV